MRQAFGLLLLLFTFQPLGAAESKDSLIAHPVVRLETTEGTIVIELDARRAPLSARHFIELAESGFYKGTIFHRVVRGFVVQGGGHNVKYELKEDARTIPNESGNGLLNVRGSVAMARTNDPHSANSQFYINLADNMQLDPQPGRWGYAVFGKVTEGMDVVDAIANLPTGPGGAFKQSVPAIPIVIEDVKVLAK